jgi:hypothetical protein
VLDWLVASCDVFGLACQNWMLVLGGGVLLYIVMLIIVRRRQSGLH